MKKRKILQFYFLTFVPIVVTAIVAVLLIFQMLAKEFQKEINTQYYKSVARLQIDIDNALINVFQQTHALVWDSAVTSFSKESSPLKNNAIFNAYTISNTMKSKKSLASYDYENMLYFKNSDTMVFSGGMVDSKTFHKKYATKYVLEYEEWLEIISTSTKNDFTVRQVSDEKGDNSYLILVKPISRDLQSKIISSNVVIIDLHALVNGIIKQSLLSDSGVFVYEGQNLLFTSGNKKLSLTHDELLKSENTDSIVKMESKQAAAALLPSKILKDLKYIIETPTAVLYKEISRTYLPVALIVLTIVLVGVFLTWLFITKNYRSVQRIQSLIFSQTEKKQAVEDYHVIETALIDMISTNQKISDNAIKQANVIRQNLLTGLLLAPQNDYRTVESGLKGMELPLYCGRVMLISFFGRYSMEMLASINKRFGQFPTPIIFMCTVSIEPTIFMMVSLKKNVLEEKATEEIVNILKDFLKEYPDLKCAVSNVKESYKNFNNAYNEIVIAMETYAESDENIIAYGAVQRKLRAEYDKVFLPSIQNEFNQLLVEGNFDGAAAFITKVLGNWQINNTMTLFMAKSMMFTVINGAINRFAEKDMGISYLLTNETDVFERIASAQTAEELKSVVGEGIGAMREAQTAVIQIKENVSAKSTQIVARVQEYIDKHYSEQELNVSIISQHFDLNLSYLSKIFKEITGKNVLTVINLKRVEYAKELLKNTDQSIKIIAEKAGFYDSNSFIRCLKRYEGTTPSRYREYHL